jgi:hypothetical protein
MAEIIEAAREHDGQLRSILTDPTLLGERARRDGKKNIAKAADAYCRKFWGHGVRAVIYQRCPEPPTGEVRDTEGHCPTQSALRTRIEDNSKSSPEQGTKRHTFVTNVLIFDNARITSAGEDHLGSAEITAIL